MGSASFEDLSEHQTSIHESGDRQFRAFWAPAIRWTLRILPWAILALLVILFEVADLIAGQLPAGTGGLLMYGTGMAAVAAALFAFQALMERVPGAVRSVWARGVIGPRRSTPSGRRDALAESGAVTTGGNPATSQGQCEAFLDDVERTMNQHYQWLVGLAFFLLVFTWSSRFPLSGTSSVPDVVLYAGLAVEFPIAMIVGLMVWRMFVIGIKVWSLGTNYVIVPKPADPDGSGGLEPVGNLCLWNALVVSAAGVYLGGWIIIGPNTQYAEIAEQYAPLFLRLLLVPLVIALISFFLPLWRLHQAMAAHKAELQQRLDQLAQTISDLQHEILRDADEMEPEEIEKKSRKLQSLVQIYRQSENPPTWPFNVRILTKFASAQAIPLLGLTGIGESVVSVLKVLADSLAALTA